MIFYRVRASMKEMKSKSTSTASEMTLAKKLGLIVLTDFLCWVCNRDLCDVTDLSDVTDLCDVFSISLTQTLSHIQEKTQVRK